MMIVEYFLLTRWSCKKKFEMAVSPSVKWQQHDMTCRYTVYPFHNYSHQLIVVISQMKAAK